MLEILFSKVGLGIAALLGAFLLWWRGNYHQAKAESAKQECEAAKAEVEVARKQLEVQHEVEKVKEEIDNLDADGILYEFHTGRLRRDNDS